MKKYRLNYFSLFIVIILIQSCVTKPPQNPDNICLIFKEKRNWYKASIQKPKFVKEFAKKYISIEKIGRGDDLVDLIKLVISNNNKFINGSILRIDGGLK